MVALPEKPTPASLEQEARALWASQRLPPLQGPVGGPDGPVVRQFLGAFAPQEGGTLTVQRAVAADIDARALMLAGRRAQGSLRMEFGGPPRNSPKLEPVLAALAVWVGGSDGHSWDVQGRRPEVQRLVGRLAHAGALAVRDVSLRICPACATARSPEGIVYQEEDGETLLVRFPFPDGDRTVSAIVWTDAGWRLLGTSALMIHPDLPYVIARYQRKDVDELIFTSKSSLDRLRGWLPGATLEVLEEWPGKHWEGRAYTHPLRHEFPMGGALEPPGGTIVPVADVSDTGTGVVPLVPGHGGTDTQIADRLGVPGWPLVTPKGLFDILFVHKYAGLELVTANDFVVRDLDESGAIFARLHVRRGVPRCARCGTAVIWAPGRAWCLEPSRLPAERIALYRALLPRERSIERLEAVPWPVSEPQRSDDAMAVPLLECSSCDRLDAPDRPDEKCVCGGRRRLVRRRLLPAFDAAASAWAGVDPFPASDTVRLYVNERRRAPTVVHHIAAMSGVLGVVGDVRLTLLPTVPDADVSALAAAHGADAVRSALARSQAPDGATITFAERCAQEARRLESFWQTAASILRPIDGASLAGFAQPIAASLGSLEPEDRAILARFERIRIQALVDYERGHPAEVHRPLFQFLENDLVEYRAWVAGRLAEAGNAPSKRAANHTLVHLLHTVTQLLGPIAPHTAESVHRALRRSRASLFQEPSPGVDRTLLDAGRVQAWDRWRSVVESIERFRRAVGVPAARTIPVVALVVDNDATADEFRAEAPTIERLARIGKLEVGSPGAPWAGRRRQLRPRESEIQRVYSSRAAQIIHLLRRMPERKGSDAASVQGFTIMVNGQPTQILPSMIAWEETLPDRYVPFDWSSGELYAELPEGVGAPTAPPPPLSPDAFRLVARVRQRLRASPSGAPPVVLVAAPPALAADLSPVVGPLARYLGVAEVRLLGTEAEMPRHGRGYGRTKAGASWSFHISDRLPPPRAAKPAPPRRAGPRVRPAFAPGDLVPTGQDYADPAWIAREGSIRSLGEELDQLLGAPILGPAKVGAAWDAGLQSVDAFRTAPWNTLVALPGFGVPVATALVEKFGGEIPPRPSTAERRAALGVRPPANGDSAPTWSAPAPVVPTPTPSREPAYPAPPPPVFSRPSPGEVRAPVVARPPPAPRPPVETAPLVPSPPPPAREAPPPEPPREEPVPPPDLPPPDANPLPVPEESPPEAPAGELPPPATSELAIDAPVPPEESIGAGSDQAASAPPAPEAEFLPASLSDSELAVIPEPETATPPVAPGPTEPPEPEAPAPMESEPTPANAASSESAPAGPEAPEIVPAVAPPEVPDLTASEPDETAPLSTPAEVREPSAPSDELIEPASSPSPVVDSAERSTSEAAAPGDLVLVPSGPPEPAAEQIRPPEEPSPPPALESPPEPPALPAELAPPRPEVVPSPEPVVTPPPPTAEPAIPPVADALLSAPVLPTTEEAAPVPAPPPAPPAPPVGGIDLAVGTSYVPSLERFLEATAAGHQGVCIVRDSPERVRAYVGSRPVDIRWLTNIGRGPTLKPTDLEGLAAFLTRAVTTEHVTAFFLEGVEYLVRVHGLDKVLARLVDFDRQAREHEARVWLPLNPKLLSPAELDRFVQAMGGAGPPA